MPWAARRRSPAGSWTGVPFSFGCTRPITAGRSGRLRSGRCFARLAAAKPVFDAFDDRHGRLVRRRVFVCPEAADLKALDTWSGLRTVLAVETIRGGTGSGKVEAEIRYFLSSCRDDPPALDHRKRAPLGAGCHVPGG